MAHGAASGSRSPADVGATLIEHTRHAFAAHAGAPILVGLSGGGDSSALLHVLATTPELRARGLRALHVDHGLAKAARAWSEHCAAFAATLGVPLEIARVEVRDDRGEGLEAVARRARHAAFARCVRKGEILALAHHQDDQLETIVLKLMRGAGPAGLGGMRAVRPFAAGSLLRPWLEVPRDLIKAYLRDHALDVIEDPANHAARHARTHLRHDLLPRLFRVMPQARAGILHSAALARATADHLDAEADAALDRLAVAARLDASRWLALDNALRPLVLERWLHRLGLPAPNQAQRRELEIQARHASGERVACVDWPGAEVRLWQASLHAMKPLPKVDRDWSAPWRARVEALPLGWLIAQAEVPPGITLRLPRCAERIVLGTDMRARPVAEIFRAHGVLPWLRPLHPILVAGDAVLGIPGLCVSAAGAAFFRSAEALPVWRLD